MKNLRTATMCACIALCCLCSSAQEQKPPVNQPAHNKPLLFKGLPDRIPVNPGRLAELVTQELGNEITTSFTDKFPFSGQVISTANNYGNSITSVVIRSANFPGARLTLSRIVIDGNTSYTGRILSMQHGDLFELQQKDGEYLFVKKNYYDLVNE